METGYIVWNSVRYVSSRSDPSCTGIRDIVVIPRLSMMQKLPEVAVVRYGRRSK